MSQLKVFDTHVCAQDASELAAFAEIVLRFDQRQKARQRAELKSGEAIGIQLPRGTILRGGDYLVAADGSAVRVVAAAEPVSVVVSDDPLLLARAAYHLGNRHVNLQVSRGSLLYLADHVLDHMVRSMGLVLMHDELPFEPEAGAYAHHANGHDHGHSHEFQQQHGVDDHEH